jgi:hypothetical protein
MTEWHFDPDRIDNLSNARIVLDTIQRVGKTRVTQGPITTNDVPSFLKNRYSPHVVEFISTLMEAKRLSQLEREVVHE